MPNYEVISALIDDEPFDPELLSEALADPAGRELLIDLLTLRKLNRMDDKSLQTTGMRRPRRAPRTMRLALAAAVVAMAVLGGYELGERSGAKPDSPPAPTLVIKSDGSWQEIPSGGSR